MVDAGADRAVVPGEYHTPSPAFGDLFTQYLAFADETGGEAGCAAAF